MTPFEKTTEELKLKQLNHLKFSSIKLIIIYVRYFKTNRTSDAQTRKWVGVHQINRLIDQSGYA